MVTNRDLRRSALWLLPSLPSRDRIAKLIDDLARRYKTLPFAPHVTLLSGLIGEDGVLAEKAYALARIVEPFEVRLGVIDCGNTYFRSIFAGVEPAGSLAHLHHKAATFFDTRADPGYQPHLSLLYGDPRDASKIDVSESLGGRFDIAFRVESIALYQISGGPAAWQCVGEYSLGGG